MDDDDGPEPRPADTRLITRAALLGVAGGIRSSLAPGALTLTSPSAGLPVRLAALTSIAAELTADKFPAVPDRTSPVGLAPRLAGAAGSSLTLARRVQANPAWPTVAAVAGATAGAFGGRVWRRQAALRMPDWQAALIEDGVALALTALAGPNRRGTPVDGEGRDDR
jgi:uncharacterized membrane protein